MKTHVTHILQKLDLRDRVQAVVFGLPDRAVRGRLPALRSATSCAQKVPFFVALAGQTMSTLAMPPYHSLRYACAPNVHVVLCPS